MAERYTPEQTVSGDWRVWKIRDSRKDEYVTSGGRDMEFLSGESVTSAATRLNTPRRRGRRQQS